MQTFYGILIPFLGTTLGAACVFFLKKNLNESISRALTGFAAGVMVAASIWSLLLPAMEQVSWMGKLSFLPAAIGFWIGVLFLLLLDHIIPHLHLGSDAAEGPKSQLQRTTMMVLATTFRRVWQSVSSMQDFSQEAHKSPLPAHLRSPLALPFRTFRRAQSSRCPCAQRA